MKESNVIAEKRAEQAIDEKEQINENNIELQIELDALQDRFLDQELSKNQFVSEVNLLKN